MSDRCFSETPIQGDQAWLTGPEAHHLIHVMRAAAGTRVVLFDGSGAEFQAEVLRAGRNDVELAVLARAQVDRELPVDVTLGVTLPKGDRQKWLVEKAVELGVRRLVPLGTTRSVVQPGPQMATRLRRAVIEASKQCGRNRLMEIAPPQDWADWVAAGPSAALRLVAHRAGGQPRRKLPPGIGQAARRRRGPSCWPSARKAGSPPRRSSWPRVPDGSLSIWDPASCGSRPRRSTWWRWWWRR